MLGKTQTFFLQYFCRESAFCGSLMTHKLPHKVPHKVPHKLPHKTDMVFLEPIHHGGGVHANAHIFGASYN